MVVELESLIGLIHSFWYVLTTENPADLITRGLTLERFKTCIQFWCHGSDWLCSGITLWAIQELPCLNQHSQWIAHSSLNAAVIQREEVSTVLPLEKFSFAKLLRVTALVIMFINRLRRLKVDSERLAATILMKTMQQEAYLVELAFLQDS